MSAKRFEFITFDCYGTLIDWETGISEAFLETARSDGVDLRPDDVLRAHAETEPEIQRGAYRSYREVLRETALHSAPRLGWSLQPERAGFLTDSLPGWTPFADVNPALEALRAAGCRLGILSNIDDDLLRGTLEHFTVEFDLLITAEQVRSYKPAHGHFLAARERIGDARWLHAARSHFHDVEPSVALGIPAAWVNRTRERPSGEARPDVEVESLGALATWLGVKTVGDPPGP